jgi:hypothetical protein
MKPRVKAALAFAGVFALGVVTGGGAMRFRQARTFSGFVDGDPVAGRQRAVLWALDRKLDLDRAQRDRIEAILAAHEPELDAAQRAMEPQVAPVFAKIEEEIRATLTAEQRPRFDELSKRFHARRLRAMGAEPPGH